MVMGNGRTEEGEKWMSSQVSEALPRGHWPEETQKL